MQWTFADPEAQRPTLIQATGPGGLIQKLTLSYDPSGNPLAILDEARAQPRLRTFSYDTRHRLAGFTDNHPRGFPSGGTFQYDAAGNRLNWGAVPLGYGGSTYPPDAMSLWGASATAYDAQGNRTTRLDSLLSNPTGAWTDDNRLATLTMSAPRTMKYDSDGRRTRVNREGVNRIHVDPEYESDLQALTHTKHVLLDGSKAMSLRQDANGSDTSPGTGAPGQRVHLFQDHLGSTDVVMAWDGVAGHAYVGEAYFYDPWGQVNLTDLPGNQTPLISAASTRYQFTGYERNETTIHLYYAGARHYDARSGRFLSEDPALIGATEAGALDAIERTPQLQNAYAYALNRPTALVDPDGTLPISTELPNSSANTPGVFFSSYSEYRFGDLATGTFRLSGFLNESSARPDLGYMGNFIRMTGGAFGNLDSVFEQALFENYWLSGGDIELSDERFRSIVRDASGRSYESRTALDDNLVRLQFDFYDNPEYDAGLGDASIDYDRGRAVGFYDTYDFNPVRWGVRSSNAETVTRSVNFFGKYHRATPFVIRYSRPTR